MLKLQPIPAVIAGSDPGQFSRPKPGTPMVSVDWIITQILHVVEIWEKNQSTFRDIYGSQSQDLNTPDLTDKNGGGEGEGEWRLWSLQQSH